MKSPVGEISFAALKVKVSGSIDSDVKDTYTTRLVFDGSTKEGAKWKETVTSINPRLLGTKHAPTPNHFTVQAKTKKDVVVTDASGNVLTQEEIPFITGGSAQMVCTVNNFNPMGGGLYLDAVILGSDIETSAPSTDSGESAEARRSRILDTIKNLP